MSAWIVQPELMTERLVLRPCTEGDVDALWALWAHPEVRRFLWDARLITREEAAATVADCLALAPRGLGLWTLWLRPGSTPEEPAGCGAGPIGCAALLPVSEAARFEPRLTGLVEPLVALDPSSWGRGYAVEALRALLTYATGELGLPRLAGVTDVPNAASDRMLRSAGFSVLSECAGPRYRLRTYLYEMDRGTP